MYMYLYILPLFQQSTALCLHNLMQTMTELSLRVLTFTSGSQKLFSFCKLPFVFVRGCVSMHLHEPFFIGYVHVHVILLRSN